MAESPATESLTQRLAIGRLTRAGILDRGSLRRTHDRFALPPRTSALDRLHRRIESATPSTDSLPLVRIDRSIAMDSAAPMNPIASVPTSAAAASAPTGETALSFGGGHVARQTPGISRTGELVARRVANTPGLVAAGSTTSGILKHGQSSQDAAVRPIVAGAASLGTLSRTAEPRSGHAESPAGVPALAAARLARSSSADSTVSRSASPSHVAATAMPISAAHGQPTSSPLAIARSAEAMVWRKAEGSVQTSVRSLASTPSVVTSSINGGVSESLAMSGGVSRASRTNDVSSKDLEQTAPSSPASTGGLPRISAGMTGHAASPLIWRKPNPTSPIPTVTALAGTTSSPTIAAAPTQLVLRKAMVSTTASQSPTQPPSITPSPPQIVARTMDDSHRSAHAGTSTPSHDWNIDWITEQVGRRLARRLEIERERMGARSWR